MQINKVHHMDAIKGLQKLEDNSADIVLVDPPYNIGKKFGDSKFKMEMEEYVDWCVKWIRECERILKDTGTMYIYGFSEILAHLSVKMELPHRWLIWHYTNKATPSSKFWQRSHESIIVAWKPKRIFNLDDVREPYTETYVKGYKDTKRTRPKTEGRFSHSKTGKETSYKVHDKGALPRDVLKIGALAGGRGMKEAPFYCKEEDKVYPGKELKNFKKRIKDGEKLTFIKHPTQKPYDVTEKLLKAVKPEKNGLVVIPFIGSGSEAVVAKDLDMDFIGFELEEDYVKLAEGFITMRRGEK